MPRGLLPCCTRLGYPEREWVVALAVRFRVNFYSKLQSYRSGLQRRDVLAKFSGRLAKAPIVYALCQVKFPIVGSIDESLAEAVHRSLRADYPYLVPQNIAEFSMLPAGATPASVIRRAWILFDRRKSSGYILDSTTLVYRTTVYRDFEHFVEQAMRGVRCVIDILKPAVIERVGLRFVDLIEGTASADLEKYIEFPLHGFKPNVEGFTPQVTQQLIRGKTKQGELVFRYSRARHAGTLPMELADPLLTTIRAPRTDKDTVLIDIDHYRDNADLDPNLDIVRELVLDLQGPMSTLFKDAVTSFAIDQWNTP